MNVKALNKKLKNLQGKWVILNHGTVFGTDLSHKWGVDKTGSTDRMFNKGRKFKIDSVMCFQDCEGEPIQIELFLSSPKGKAYLVMLEDEFPFELDTMQTIRCRKKELDKPIKI